MSTTKIGDNLWLATPDARGRISLGPVGGKPGQRYRVDESDSGTIMLTPVKLVEGLDE